eukprot:366490-Chlamydomonas_euryale.AAC.23
MAAEGERREAAVADYRKKLLKHREVDSKVRSLRESVKELKKEYDKTEDDLKALQSVGQIIGEVLRQLDDERFIVKASSGPRYVVGCRSKVDKVKLTQGTRVALDMTTLTIMRSLPRENQCNACMFPEYARRACSMHVIEILPDNLSVFPACMQVTLRNSYRLDCSLQPITL